jgi:fibro-slime domain-containing protein
LFLLIALVSTGQAKTLMWLTDEFTGAGSNVDSVMHVNGVYIPHYDGSSGYSFGTVDQNLILSNAYAAPIPVNQTYDNAAEPDSLKIPQQLYRNWYALPNFSSSSYYGGEIRIYFSYLGMMHRPLLNPPTPHIQRDTQSAIGQTSQLNQSSGTQEGAVDICVDTTESDTVWIRMEPDSLPSQISNNPSASAMRCYNHNPFFQYVGTVHVYNPWPGKSDFVELGNQFYPTHPDSGRPGWYSTSLYTDPRNPIPFKVRVASGDPTAGAVGVQYLDAGGLNGTASGAFFDFTTTPGTGGTVWITPPLTQATSILNMTAPAVALTLYIQDPPWSSTTLRAIWKGQDARFIPVATQYGNSACSSTWYMETFYKGAVPSYLALSQPLGDTLFGSKGQEPAPTSMAAYANWITLPPLATTLWMSTSASTATFATAQPAGTATCNTKILALSTYDYTYSLSRTDAHFYEPFGELGPDDNCPESGNSATKGLVSPVLNARGRPTWGNKIACDVGLASDGPQYWFDSLWNVPGTAPVATIGGKIYSSATGNVSQVNAAGATPLNAFYCYKMTLTLDNTGYYSYNNQAFFPLDTVTSIPSPFRPTSGSDFHFAMHAKAAFEYTPGLQFSFAGDDDLWIFINKKLALDLGGQHGTVAGSINLDNLGLVEGKSYQFDMFYTERHSIGSDISIKTTMNLVPMIDVVFDSSAATATTQDYQISTATTTSRADICPEQGAASSTTYRPANAIISLQFPDGTQQKLDSTFNASYPGLSISNQNSHINVDTTALKKSGKLTQSGVYQIVITVGTDSRTISFTVVFQTVDVNGTLYDRNGDGRADSVVLHAVGAVSAFKTVSSVVLHWADFTGNTDSVTIPGASFAILDAGDSVMTATFPALPFRTNCPPSGCTGAMGTVNTVVGGSPLANAIRVLSDGIPPVADSAWLVYDSTGTGYDTLYVVPSEPVTGSVNGPWVIAGANSLPRPISTTGTVLAGIVKIAFPSASDPILPGDSLRLGGQISDLSGNSPGTYSRWVPIQTTPIAKSWMLDTNGDGAPDAIHIRARGDFATATSVTVHWKTASGSDTAFSVTTAGLGSVLTLPPGILQNATHCVGCHIDVVAPGNSQAFALLDSVAPVAVSASYRFGATMDTLVVIASEYLFKGAAAGENWVAQKRIADQSASGALVSNGTPFGTTTNALTLLVPPGTFTGDSLRLRGWSADSFRNAPGAISRWVPVVYSAQPLGVAVYDENGDGRADSVVFSLSRSASGAPVPTAFSVQWGGQTISISSLSRSPDGLSWSGPIGPFASATTAPIPGEMGWIRVGTDSTTWHARVADSVPPVATKAVYRYGLTMDTLIVSASEALVQGSAAGEGWVAQKSAPSQSASGTVAVGTVQGTTTKTLVLLVVPGAFTGDSLRLRAWSKDFSGNAPGAVSPWVPVVYGPQPIRVQVFDENGDGRADSVVFKLARSANGVPLPDSFTVQWNGQTLSAKSLVRSADQLSWKGPIGPFVLGTAPAAGDAGWFDVGSDVTSYRAVVEDSVAPVARTASLVFGFDPGTPDTLVVNGSEGLSLNGANLVLLNSDSSNTGAYLPAGAMIDPVGSTGTVLKLIVASGSIANDAAWARFGTSVSDKTGATVGTSSLWVRLVTKPSGRAYLYDSDGDGRADSVQVLVRGSLPAVSAVVTWTDASGKTDTRTWSVGTTSGAFGLHPAQSSLWFAKGATSCPTGNCSISFLDATGTELVSWPLVDSVAPMAISGTYAFGTSQDTLRVTFSEPLTQLSKLSSWVEWGNATTSGAVIHFTASLNSAGTVATLVLDTAQGAHAGWDSVRIATGSLAGKITDQKGVKAGTKSPWAPLAYGLPPLVAKITDPQGKGRGTDVVIRLGRSVPAGAISAISTFHLTWDGTSRDVAVSSLAWDATGKVWTGSVGTPFALGATAPGTVYGAQVASSNGSTRVIGLEDGVPPSILRAQYRYSTPEVAQDTLIVDLSEAWQGEAPGNIQDPFVAVRDSANALPLAPMLDWSVSTDHKTLKLIVDTAWESKLKLGDSARLAYLVQGSRIWDAAQNRVGVDSRWVPIEFGLRPIEFVIRQEHALLVNKGDNTWTEPLPDVPQMEILVRQDGTDNWVRVDENLQTSSSGTISGGAQAKNNPDHVMAVYLRLNRPLDGEIFVYDNIGTSVVRKDLSDLRKLWPPGTEDVMREVRITWNGTGATDKFVATGVYLLRAVVKVNDGAGHIFYKNLLWKYGWQHGTN